MFAKDVLRREGFGACAGRTAVGFWRFAGGETLRSDGHGLAGDGCRDAVRAFLRRGSSPVEGGASAGTQRVWCCPLASR